jgi:hypothetical protein
MTRLPFGVARLDTLLDGGAPPGSIVLLAGEPGAGARAFLYTAAVRNALAMADPDQFELAYGRLPDAATIPEEVHLVSFTASEPATRAELRTMFEPAIVEAGLETITVTDFAGSYFDRTPVPDTWYPERVPDSNNRSKRAVNRGPLRALTDYLQAEAAGNLIGVDALSDLGELRDGQLGWNQLAIVLKGLRRAAEEWGGLILFLLNKTGVPPAALGQLMGAVDGTFEFDWAAGGHELDRTMALKAFRGVLPTIDDDELVRFETEIQGTGFQLSEVRKIR